MFVTVLSAEDVGSLSSAVVMCEADGFALCFENAIIGLRMPCFAECFACEIGFGTGDRDLDLIQICEIGFLFGAGDRDLDLMIDSSGHIFCMVAEVVTEDEAQNSDVVFDGNTTLKTCIIFEPSVQYMHVYCQQVKRQGAMVARFQFHISSDGRVKSQHRKKIVICWSLTRARPHREDTSVASPTSGRHWCGLFASVCADPGSFACHMFGPAGCAVGIPCCPFIATLLAEDVCFYAPVA